MCRPKELGGRRCPQHTDPVKHAAYNARRREVYAQKKTVSTPVDDAVTRAFPPLSEPRSVPSIVNNELDNFYDESNDFRDLVWPEYDEDEWEYLASSENWVPENSPAEAIQHYTSHGYKEYRTYSLGKMKPSNIMNVTAQAVAHMDNAIQSCPPPAEPRRVYRGLRIPTEMMDGGSPEEYMEEHFPIGGVVSQESFMSTSLHPNIAYEFTRYGAMKDVPVLFEIVSKQGAPIGDGLTTSSHEYEVIMPRKAKFKVVGVHHNANFSAVQKTFREPETNTYKNITVIQLMDVSE
jgi:hypothetical protein